MSKSCALARLSNAMSAAADGNGRVFVDTLKDLGFDEDTIRSEGPDALRLTMVREVTSIRLELVSSK